MRNTSAPISCSNISRLAAATPANAQQWRWNERGWRTIGYTRVDGRDSDTINLPGATRQREIRLCAMNQPLRLRDFDIRFANGGREWQPTGEPEQVNVHDFPDPTLGKAIPYGVDDVGANSG